MRKITAQAMLAFYRRENFNGSNTTVYISEKGESIMRLHGNEIARLGKHSWTKKNAKLTITNAGWFTNTTKDRLNALVGVSIYQKAGEWYLNEQKWDGKTIEIAY